MKIINKDKWLEMYKAAERIRDLAAWNWMNEDDVFIVQDPSNENNHGFCSIMGSNGEFYALAIYKGWDGFKSYNDLRYSSDLETEIVTMNYSVLQNCWMIEFTNSKEMNKTSKDTLKELGIKYRGDLNWIDISDRSPGLLPWYVEEEDVSFITTCINQFFEIALRAEEDSDFLHKPNPEFRELDVEDDYEDEDIDEWLEHSEELILKRVGIPQPDGKVIWTDEYLDAAPYEELSLKADHITPSIKAAALAKKLEVREAAILLGMLMVPSPIQSNKDEQPYLACLTLYIQYGSNHIIAQGLNAWDNTKANFEKELLSLFEKIGFIPSQLVVNMPILEDWLESFAELFDFEIILNPEEESFEDALTSILGMLGGAN